MTNITDWVSINTPNGVNGTIEHELNKQLLSSKALDSSESPIFDNELCTHISRPF